MLTDLPEVDELVARNIDAANCAMSSSLEFVPLDWEQPLPKKVQSRAFDIIVVAECIYNTDSIPPLIDTLSALLERSPKAVIVLSTKVRHQSEELFWELIAKTSLVKKGQLALPLPGAAGTGYADSATQVDLYVFHGPQFRRSFSPDEYELGPDHER